MEIISCQVTIHDNCHVGGQVTIAGGNADYSKLINKPSINGTVLVGNYDEIDPTVPDWAKQETKPEYSTNEIGAVDKNQFMTTEEINSLFDAIFN